MSIIPTGGINFLNSFKYGSQIAVKNSPIKVFLTCGTQDIITYAKIA